MEMVLVDDQVMPGAELLEHYKIVALTLYRAHKACVAKNKTFATAYNIITILITSITGSSSLSLMFEEYTSLKVMNVVLSYFVVALGTLYRYYIPDKRKEQHKVAAEEYIRLYYQIIETLIFNTVTTEYIKTTNKCLEDLRENSPYINDDLYDKYKVVCQRTYKKNFRLQT